MLWQPAVGGKYLIRFHTYVFPRVLIMRIRSPIVATLGHVDHGKTTVLDSIRGSNVAAKEAGKITQMIGASYITREAIERMSGRSGGMRFNLKIPGLLLIDTPGHEAFTNLRDRGGSIADIAMLVIDVMQGIQPQTVESIRILKQYKTPFVIVANKIDMTPGWKSYKDEPFTVSFAKQPEHVQEKLDEKLYGLMGKLSEHGFDSERFDRITDFSKQVAIVPVSARTKECLGDLLMLIAGLSQKFLEGKLEIEEAGRGKGSIIEVKEEKGMGTTIDVILFDGILRKNDDVLFLTSSGAGKTKVRGLLVPNIGGGKDKFTYVDEVVAAAGVKIFAPELEGALPGSPLEVVQDFDRDKVEIEAKFKSVVFEKKDEAGVVLRADSLGSVEALVKLLTDAGIPIRDAGVGKITRKDVVAAKTVAADNRYLGAVLGFNVPVLDDATLESTDSGIPIIWSDIIYHLLDRYREWVEEEKVEEKKEALAHYTCPGKLKALPGFVFRVNKPAIFGVEVLGGRIKRGYRLMNKAGEIVGEIREIQKDKDKVDEATGGQQLAISCDGIYYGKNVNESDVLYVFMTGDEIKMWAEKSDMLSGEEKAVLEEVKQMQKRYF
jgi:translation initiation factor 5B